MYFIVDDNGELAPVECFQEVTLPASGFDRQLRRFTSSFLATTNKKTFDAATFVRDNGHVFHCVPDNVMLGSSTMHIEGFISRDENRSDQKEVMEKIQKAL